MEIVDFEIFKDKTVLLTGHTGFKGSWLSIWFNKLGAKVIGYSLDPKTSKDNFVLTNLTEKIIDIRGDIRDFDKLKNVFTEYSPEFVFHFAAQSLVKESYKFPKETYDTNIGGTVNVLECCRLTDSVKVIINVTSDKCYKNNEWIWGYRENDPMGGFDPYSSSKGCSELITSAYRNSYFNIKNFKTHGKVLSSVRAGNVIGGGDWSENRLIPDCIKAIESSNDIVLRNPEATRPWQFVLEPLRGYLLLATKMYKNPKKYYGPWNFGPNHNSIIQVKELVNLLIDHYCQGRWKVFEEQDKQHEATLLSLDISKAKLQLGWNPILNIDKAIEFTTEWYKTYKQKQVDMYDFCIAQINKYLLAVKNDGNN
ncbi:MAG: CDP-glucose 4,6-dehydratase [Bacteroidales bacterium]|nr:CDP-glucose 4,6-dehydratase [Bacteroidales bacterium]